MLSAWQIVRVNPSSRLAMMTSEPTVCQCMICFSYQGPPGSAWLPGGIDEEGEA